MIENNRKIMWILISIFCLILIIIFKDNAYIMHMLFMAFLYGGLSGGWNLIGGYGGVISLGHAIYFGIGAYTSTLLFVMFGISPWISMIVGIVISLAFCLSIGTILIWRLKTHFFALSSIAVVEIFRLMTIYFKSITRGSEGIPIPSDGGIINFILPSKVYYVVVAFIFLAVVTVISYFIHSRKLGYDLIALKEDENAAKSLGINIVKTKSMANAISAVLISLGGTIYAQYTMFIDPEMTFSITNSVQMALYAIIGGIATVEGPVIGALIFVPLKIFIINTIGGNYVGFDIFLYGIIFVTAVLFFPRGLMGVIEKYFLLREKTDKKRMIDKKYYIEKEMSIFTKLKNNGEIILSIENINKHFAGLHAIKNLTFKIIKGEIISIIGPNGAGKTTLFNIITNFLRKDSGIIKYKGEVINNKSTDTLCLENHIVRTFQLTKPFSHMTVLENIMVGAFSRCNNTLEARSRAITITKFIEMEEYMNATANNLPVASKKRMEIGRALATEPELLLLDECLAGLNAEEIHDVIKLIRKITNNGIDVVIIEHVMSAVMSLSDRVIVLDHGEKIAEGTPKEISENKKVIEVYMGS